MTINYSLTTSNPKSNKQNQIAATIKPNRVVPNLLDQLKPIIKIRKRLLSWLKVGFEFFRALYSPFD